ncbi:hypothetical protein F5883DRAFT_551649 [Diaporthe sp. PMI_573]|nr:hypothetical protein F5883DRAFT_551649 [Diaporthaceae sp. PMI_573]
MDLIEEASADELRAVVLALCKDTSVQIRIEVHLKKLRDAQSNAAKTGQKRKAEEQFFICVRCGETFNEEANHSKSCTYHHGKCASSGGYRPSTLLTKRHSGEMEVRDEEDFLGRP